MEKIPPSNQTAHAQIAGQCFFYRALLPSKTGDVRRRHQDGGNTLSHSLRAHCFDLNLAASYAHIFISRLRSGALPQRPCSTAAGRELLRREQVHPEPEDLRHRWPWVCGPFTLEFRRIGHNTSATRKISQLFNILKFPRMLRLRVLKLIF